MREEEAMTRVTSLYEVTCYLPVFLRALTPESNLLCDVYHARPLYSKG